MKIKKEYLIGAAIALVAMVCLFFMPIVNVSGSNLSLFDAFDEAAFYALTWIIFPVLCIIANLLGKFRNIAAWLMFVPFLYAMVYFAIPSCSPGYGVWIYGVLTVVLILYTKKTANA